MKILFDSSVLIAAFIESHPKHKPAISYLLKAKQKEFELLVSSHSLLEIYSVLTSAPFKPRISPGVAFELIDNNIKKIAKIISLNGAEYFSLVKNISASGFTGGIVYDALVVDCALKANADEIITLNYKDFIKLNEGIELTVTAL